MAKPDLILVANKLPTFRSFCGHTFADYILFPQHLANKMACVHVSNMKLDNQQVVSAQSITIGFDIWPWPIHNCKVTNFAPFSAAQSECWCGELPQCCCSGFLLSAGEQPHERQQRELPDWLPRMQHIAVWWGWTCRQRTAENYCCKQWLYATSMLMDDRYSTLET